MCWRCAHPADTTSRDFCLLSLSIGMLLVHDAVLVSQHTAAATWLLAKCPETTHCCLVLFLCLLQINYPFHDSPKELIKVSSSRHSWQQHQLHPQWQLASVALVYYFSCSMHA
eukprot:GHRQ01030172.1.p3 GENE.GHRQ01030172.1~~GHRQ01030172.1.p3  ORF type:complete len:113 (+),score=35.25 GHRQ01030172.1:564-902(+)